MSKEKKFAPKKYIVGKYAVGTSCYSVVDTGRKEVLGDCEGDRKIAVRMYYPAAKEDVEGKQRATIFSDAKKAAIMKAYHIRKVSDEMNYADYYENVPVAQGTKFPLIMFSMGYNSYVESNTYLLSALASSGYIVASVGHAYEAVENDYEDGSYDLYDKKINKRMYNGKWKKPFCQISCKENVNVETRPLVQTKADTYLVIFEDMKHMGFTDAKFYIPIKMLSGKLDSEEMFRHLMYCHIRFFDQYLKGKDVTFKGMTSDKVHYKKIN